MSATKSVPATDRQRSPSQIGVNELLLIFAFWTFIATLSSVNRWLDPRGFGVRMSSPTAPIAMEFAEAWLWAAVTPLVFRLTSRLTADRSNWLVTLPLLLVAGIGIAIAVYLVLAAIRMEVMPPPRRHGIHESPVADILRLRFVNQFLVYIAVLAAGIGRNFYLRDRYRQEEAVALQARAAQLEAQLAGARLDALRMQLNPHFLFNTLHAISALVERDPSGVRRMIARLSELLRHTIESRGTDEVPLRDELEFLRRYIEIMEVRFQGRLRIEMSIAAETETALVPNLILQPIVENALEHGASRSAGEGRVSISARREGEELHLFVEDNGPGLADEGVKKGVGLQNTGARLAQLYGEEEASLTVSNKPSGGVVAHIVLPFHTAADLRTSAIGGDGVA